MRLWLVAAALVLMIALAATTTASARSTTAALTCGKSVSIGMMAPITGPAASNANDQLHWAQFYVGQRNKNKKNTTKLRLVPGDTQPDPSKASAVAHKCGSDAR